MCRSKSDGGRRCASQSPAARRKKRSDAKTNTEVEELTQPDATDYRMMHQPHEEGDPASDLSETFPDIYEHPEYYSHGSETYTESMRVIRSIRGNPEAEVSIYRSVPDPEFEIKHGDWVSLSKAYAEEHGRDATDPAKDWPVVSLRVKAKTVLTGGDDINEFGYFPAEEIEKT